MKFNLLLAIILLFPSSLVFAQKNQKTISKSTSSDYDTAYMIHYRFLEGKLEIPKQIKWHPPVYRPLIIRIDNINRGAFKIVVTNRDSLLAVNDPTPFNTAFQQLQKVRPAVDEADESAKKLQDVMKGPKEVPDKAKESNKLVATIAIQKNFSEPNDSSDIKFNDVKKLSATDAEQRISTYYNLKRIFYRLENIKHQLLSKADSISCELTRVQRSLSTLKNQFLTKEEFITRYSITEDSLRDQLLKTKHIYSEVPGLAEDMKTWEERSKKYFNDTFFRAIDQAQLKNVTEVYNSIHVDSLLSSLDKINLALNYLGRNEFYRFTSPPITPMGDIIILKVAITAIDKDSTQPDNEKIYELKLFTKNRFRFDFSTGIGTLFNLSNRSYSLIPGGADSATIKKNPGNEKFIPVIAAFLHGGYDIGASFKPALTLGLSLDASSIDITTVLFGISAMMGREERLILTGGWAMKKISTLRSDFVAGQTYAKIDIGSTIPTESVFKGGWFLALSYNLTNKAK